MPVYKRIWFPNATSIAIVRQSKEYYFHSVFVGITAPILNLPYMIWNSILIPLVEGITVVAISVLSTFIAGIRGDVAGIEEVEEGLDE
jgi:hypothetical protein